MPRICKMGGGNSVKVIEINGDAKCYGGVDYVTGEPVNYTLIDVSDPKYPFDSNRSGYEQGVRAQPFYQDGYGAFMAMMDNDGNDLYGKGSVFVQGYNLAGLMAVSFVQLPDDKKQKTLRERLEEFGYNGYEEKIISGKYIITE